MNTKEIDCIKKHRIKLQGKNEYLEAHNKLSLKDRIPYQRRTTFTAGFI